MKRFVSILVASVAALAAFASPSTRQWDEGPLKWSDFKGNPAIKSTTSYFKGFLKTVTDIEHEGKTRFNSDVRLMPTPPTAPTRCCAITSCSLTCSRLYAAGFKPTLIRE